MTHKRRVLVTGAAGFLGSHLADALLDRGCEVVGADDFSTSDPGSKHHIDLISRPRFSFREVNIAEPGALLAAVGSRFHAVFNMACPASPPAYQRLPMHTLMTSVIGVASCLHIAKRADCVLVHASTSEVYGDPTVSPQDESYVGRVNTWGPRACYDEGKRAAEAMLWIARSEGHDVRLARIFNTYGPRMMLGDGRIVTELMRSALSGSPVAIHGDGSQTRSLCYVSDLISGLLALHHAPCTPDHPVNLGNPHEVSILELAETVQRVTGRHLNITFGPRLIDDPTNRRPDITIASNDLGWSPLVELDDGLRMTYQSYRDVR